MTSLLENLSFAVALPRVVRPNESLRCPTPSLKTPKTTSQQNKSQNRGVLFRPENTTAKTPSSPRIPPQLHHQNTTSNHHASPKTPSKTPKPLILTTPEKNPANPTTKTSRHPAPISDTLILASVEKSLARNHHNRSRHPRRRPAGTGRNSTRVPRLHLHRPRHRSLRHDLHLPELRDPLGLDGQHPPHRRPRPRRPHLPRPAR